MATSAQGAEKGKPRRDPLPPAPSSKETETGMRRTVYVWEEPQKVDVYQKSKTVWIAVGTYMGKRIEVNGRSENAAITHWQDAALFMGT